MECYDDLKLDIRDEAAMADGGIFKECDCIQVTTHFPAKYPHLFKSQVSQGCTEISYTDEASSAALDPDYIRRTFGVEENDTELTNEYIEGNYAK